MSGNEQHHNALPIGYCLENHRLEAVLGHGGFGITYRASDEDLRDTVAIKEYLPREVAFRERDSTVIPVSEGDRETFEWGLERFLDEARTLARFRHPNIVGVRRFLRANGTAYLVMDYCEGESLESVLSREGTLAPDPLETMLVPLLDALEALHAAGVTHRDIKPGNIYLREDGSPVLLDFGSARQALAQHSRSVTAMATPGYAAFEQYSTKGKQGPWTDLYGLGAMLYRCVTGKRPPDASDRMLEDEIVPAVEAASSHYPQRLLQQIDAALKLRAEGRPQSVADWRKIDAPGAPTQVTRDSIEAPGPRPVDDPSGFRMMAGVMLILIVVVVFVGFFGFFGFFVGGIEPEMAPGPGATVIRDSPASIEGRYRILGSQGEIVRDTVTSLEWQRCSLGQTWNGRTCVGEAELYTWEGARQAADRAAGWRWPTMDELRTLTFCSSGQPARFSNGQRCGGNYEQPTIVGKAFPNTPNSFFLSSTRGAGSSNFAGIMNPKDGAASIFFIGDFGFRVRLVRGGH